MPLSLLSGEKKLLINDLSSISIIQSHQRTVLSEMTLHLIRTRHIVFGAIRVVACRRTFTRAAPSGPTAVAVTADIARIAIGYIAKNRVGRPKSPGIAMPARGSATITPFEI